MNKLKSLVVAIVVAIAAMIPGAAKAQSADQINQMMNMIVGELNKSLAEEPNVQEAQWDGTNLILVMSKEATGNLSQSQVAEDPAAVKDYIITTVVGTDASEKAEFAQLLGLFQQVNVKLIVRAPLSDGNYDVEITAADLK
jgi:hypothetical protein